MLHITHDLFPVSEVLIISVTIMLFGCIFVALGFFLSPITGLLKQPEQMFADILLHEAGKLRQLLIQWDCSTVLFYDLITTDMNFRRMAK